MKNKQNSFQSQDVFAAQVFHTIKNHVRLLFASEEEFESFCFRFAKKGSFLLYVFVMHRLLIHLDIAGLKRTSVTAVTFVRRPSRPYKASVKKV